jgi:hypothetical protein
MHNRPTDRGPCRAPRLAILFVLVGLLLLPGCNDTVSNPGGIARASIAVSVEPDPVVGVQELITGTVSAAYTVTVRETAGLGGEIQHVAGTVFDPESGLQAGVNYFDAADLIVYVGTNRIEGGGELQVNQTITYVLPDLSTEAQLSVSVQLRDDNGGLVNRSILMSVVPPPTE